MPRICNDGICWLREDGNLSVYVLVRLYERFIFYIFYVLSTLEFNYCAIVWLQNFFISVDFYIIGLFCVKYL